MILEDLLHLLGEFDPKQGVWFEDRDQHGNPYKKYLDWAEYDEDGQIQIG